MSVHPDASRPKQPWKVVFTKPDGKRSTKRFPTEEEARHFDETGELLTESAAPAPQPEEREVPRGVYPDGPGKYRINVTDAHGHVTSRRGFDSPEAALLEKGRLEERFATGREVVGRDRFDTQWAKFLVTKKAQVTEGVYENYERDGRLRLLPFFGRDPLKSIDAGRVDEWLAPFAEKVLDGEVAPKTINNCLTTLSTFFNWCVGRNKMATNPCDHVDQLIVDPAEIPYFTTAQIAVYLSCCSKVYRPLAAFLIGTGCRVSEAIAVKVTDLDLDDGIVRIYRQRSRTRKAMATRGTKGKDFRPVEIGPRLVQLLRDMLALRAEHGVDDGGWLFLCPKPERGRYAKRTEPVPPHRKTVSDWHEAALAKMNEGRDEKDRLDVTLHGLRHTAAALWLQKESIYYVQRQLGHKDVQTTIKNYGHLERSYTRGAAAAAEDRIYAATEED